MKIFKLIIDTLMAVLMPMLMAYSLIGENNHEIIGICIFVIFIVHHVLNRKWWTSLFKGKYNAVRVLNTVVNLSLVVFMIMQPVSGVLLSKHMRIAFCRTKKKDYRLSIISIMKRKQLIILKEQHMNLD